MAVVVRFHENGRRTVAAHTSQLLRKEGSPEAESAAILDDAQRFDLTRNGLAAVVKPPDAEAGQTAVRRHGHKVKIWKVLRPAQRPHPPGSGHVARAKCCPMDSYIGLNLILST
jgi:hypothetical protein